MDTRQFKALMLTLYLWLFNAGGVGLLVYSRFTYTGGWLDILSVVVGCYFTIIGAVLLFGLCDYIVGEWVE